MSKRLVYIHPDGLHQILGHDGALPVVPQVIENFITLGRVVPFISLVKVTPRVAYYKEPLVPGATAQEQHPLQR